MSDRAGSNGFGGVYGRFSAGRCATKGVGLLETANSVHKSGSGFLNGLDVRGIARDLRSPLPTGWYARDSLFAGAVVVRCWAEATPLRLRLCGPSASVASCGICGRKMPAGTPALLSRPNERGWRPCRPGFRRGRRNRLPLGKRSPADASGSGSSACGRGHAGDCGRIALRGDRRLQ